MTTVHLHPTISAALAKAEQKLGEGRWNSTNQEQASLIANLPDIREILTDLPEGLIEAIGSNDTETINAWLAARGYSFRLQDMSDEEFGIAASLDVAATWSVPGSPVMIRYEGKKYPAVQMERRGFAVYAVGEHRIVAPDADRQVFMVAAPDLETGVSIIRSERTRVEDVDAVTFPMIDYDAPLDLAWLVGMEYIADDDSSQSARLSQAVGQARLRVNQFGARAKTGVAAKVYRSVPTNVVTIDEPFVLAFMHKAGVLAAFHLTPEAWAAPPDLGGQKPDRSEGKRAVETW